MKKNIPLIISFLMAAFSSVSAQDTVIIANTEQMEINALTAINEIDSAAVPFIAKKEFYKINDKQSTYTPTLQLKLVPNGVGLALNF
jgi:hypothetical protein